MSRLRGRESVAGPQSQADRKNSTEGPARILRSGAAFFSARAWKSVSLAANGGCGKSCLPHPALLLHGFVDPSAKGILICTLYIRMGVSRQESFCYEVPVFMFTRHQFGASSFRAMFSTPLAAFGER